MFASRIGLFGGGRERVVISSNQTNYNLRTALGSPTSPKDIVVVINSGVEINSNSTSTPAFDEGSGWAPGSKITIINNGKIYGMGGAGGNAGSARAEIYPFEDIERNPGSNGLPGGPALALRVPTSIDNGAGEIFGGGGGGGGGGGYAYVNVDPDATWAVGGAGGGGGRGAFTSAAGSGGAASTDVAPDNLSVAGNGGNSGGPSAVGGGGSAYTLPAGFGTTSAGGSGGGWGAAGANASAGSVSLGGVGSAGSGGAGGNAVVLNGNSITWIAGNTGARVKGPVS